MDKIISLILEEHHSNASVALPKHKVYKLDTANQKQGSSDRTTEPKTCKSETCENDSTSVVHLNAVIACVIYLPWVSASAGL